MAENSNLVCVSVRGGQNRCNSVAGRVNECKGGFHGRNCIRVRVGDQETLLYR